MYTFIFTPDLVKVDKTKCTKFKWTLQLLADVHANHITYTGRKSLVALIEILIENRSEFSS